MASFPRSRATAPGSLEALRERNRVRIVATLRSAGAVSRAELARRTALSRSTVSTLVTELIEMGLVREAQEPRVADTGGRPATALSLDPSAGTVLAVDLAPHHLSMALFDLGHRRLAGADTPCAPDDLGLDRLVAAIARMYAGLLESTGLGRESVVGASVAIPAPIGVESRRIGDESNIAAIIGDGFERAVGAALGLAVQVENDANLSALAELQWGAARGHRDAVFVELSQGIGAGLIIDGRLHRGTAGTAGEIGHLPSGDGAMCRCGNRGCLELSAGTGAITALVADRFDAPPRIADVIARAEAGDAMCRRALRDSGARVGSVLGQICNVVNPTVIVIGGELAAAWSLLEPAMREAIDRSAIHPAIDDLELRPSQLGAEGRLLGGFALVLHDQTRFPLPAAAAAATAPVPGA